MKLNKKAISIMVAYVILITITISISGIVYYWLKFYAQPSEESKCPEKVALVVKNYDCTDPGKLKLTIQNKGFFTIDGFMLRVSEREDADIGDYALPQTPETAGKNLISGGLEPNQEQDFDYNFPTGMQLKFMEIQPFILKKEETIYCEIIIKQRLNC